MLPTPLQYIGGGFLGYFLAIHPSPVSLEGVKTDPARGVPWPGLKVCSRPCGASVSLN